MQLDSGSDILLLLAAIVLAATVLAARAISAGCC